MAPWWLADGPTRKGSGTCIKYLASLAGRVGAGVPVGKGCSVQVLVTPIEMWLECRLASGWEAGRQALAGC